MEKIRNIVPGKTDLLVPPSDRAYWFFVCPSCGQEHERNVSQWWDDENGEVIRHDCFVCVLSGVHFTVSKDPPYAITRSVNYRPTASDLPSDEELLAFFENLKEEQEKE